MPSHCAFLVWGTGIWSGVFPSNSRRRRVRRLNPAMARVSQISSPGAHSAQERSLDGGGRRSFGDEHFEIPLTSALRHAQRAQNLLKAGEPDRAWDAAMRGLALAPRSVPVLTAAGDAASAQSDWAGAELFYRQAVEGSSASSPNCRPTAWRNCGRSWRRRERGSLVPRTTAGCCLEIGVMLKSDAYA